MVESSQVNDPFGAADARAALQAGEASAAALRRGMSYPTGFVAQLATVAALSSTLAGLVASDAPMVGVLTLVLVCALLGLAVTASRRFDAHNGVRIHGLRGPARTAAIGFLLAGVTLNIAIAYAADTTGAWWLGLAAAPVAAGLVVAYLRRWLVAYRGAA